ncbi:HhH-GPD-type base excision DNA repair protein [Pedococcus sp. 5OH_020]|uniref:HhH-GPD-type base excision DNA repair protein n=1 Tax=Pedococcus sp. 5OH_020 TaxID=2989814 RepID=UPI002FDB9ED2
MARQLRIAQDPAADEVLSRDPFALLVGMLLDQQYPMEHAFRGPWKILQRFGSLDSQAIAEAQPEAFADLCATPPAIHRYGRSMAGRVQQLAAVVRDEYGGRAESIWEDAPDARELLERLRALPGFGDQKARIFAALVGKQLGLRPPGWQEAVGPYAEEGSFRSVADVVDAASLAKVREFKQAAKAEAKAKAAGATTASAPASAPAQASGRGRTAGTRRPAAKG